MEKRNTYGSIDGLRTIAAIGILMMHVAGNTKYQITGYIYEKVIPSFTNFVFLFMVISAFGMCNGYCEKVINNQISFEEFYGKRFKKILPFFATLVLLDIVMSPSLSSLYEGFADLTLLFGFLPNVGKISVIGVGWFIGLVFVFYLCFPFFCCLIKTRKRAWIAFAISLIWNFTCSQYFTVGRSNILYSGCFFMAGGLIYLYRDELVERFNEKKLARLIITLIMILSIFAYYILGENTMTMLLVSTALLIYAITNRGGCFKTRLLTLSAVSVWKYISHIWLFSVWSKRLACMRR